MNNFDYKRIKTLEAELDEIHDKKTKGAQIRSKLRWKEEGEKNSKYFLNLEKHNQSSNIIKELTLSTPMRQKCRLLSVRQTDVNVA